ncbi:uncharacterized protein DUF4191 [Haloactinospora alba]|uniref:Uncharacterized protein DUF4191 n=1 Tax=Haloactinospora alba TaxID=405555 RepID=A0A543NJR8_9ACTN|nr:DUF4191 domain-containing protein [Haloactinospora alba]TQN32057.1 uncharacterized protein DUF4191 [Haloactinospora alba]
MAKQPKDSKTAQTATESKQGKSGSQQPGRFKQIGMVARVVHKQSPRSIPTAVGIALAVLVLSIVGGFLTGWWLYWITLGVPIAFLAGFVYFSRVAQKTQYAMLDGQLGAGMAILDNLRGDWTVESGVSANRQMDVVHRAVGRPGIVLVGEGDPNRLKGLLATEKKRVSRVAHSAPIYDLQVGNGSGQVPVSRLQRHLMKLPRNLKKGEVGELRNRLNAMPASMQMPKGPMPKGAKMPKGPKPQKN